MAADLVGWEPAYIRSVQYPRVLKYARVSGVVKLQVSLANDGTVAEVKTISGHRSLAETATKAVKAWRFRRTCQSSDSVNQVEMEWRFVLEGSCRGNNCEQSFEVTMPATVTVTSEIPQVEI
ncbi:MAG TPA: energy transducer TonB [Bryobacteraceae bacterium]|nr:energy transducer TonB [Bryobacteraceae bacterium]